MAPSKQLVWVVEGETPHLAHLLRYEGDAAVIQWATTDGIQTVDRSRIRLEVASSRPSRKNKAAQAKTLTAKRVKKERDDDAVNSPEVPDSSVSSSTSTATPPVTVTPDPSVSEGSNGAMKPVKVESNSSDVPDSSVSSSTSTATPPVTVTPDPSVSEGSNEATTPVKVESNTLSDDAANDTKRESEYANIMRIKKEEVDGVFSGEQKMSPELKAREEKIKKALTDPQTKGPRAVFRRGCHPLSIATVLGGQGTHPCPIVHNVPGGVDNMFIKQDQIYVAGHCDWNPWAPRFPGDNGMVDSSFVSDDQGEYHMFTSCSNKQNNPLFHGNDAKGKYLYLGMYSIPEKDSDDDVLQGLRFKDLAPRLQLFRAKYFHRKKSVEYWTDPVTGVEQRATEDEITPEHRSQALQKYRDEASACAQEKWEDMSDAKRVKAAGSLAEFKTKELAAANKKWQQQATAAAWVVMLCEKNYVIDLVPVKFQSYDEALYKELVAIGAVNGHVTLGANTM